MKQHRANRLRQLSAGIVLATLAIFFSDNALAQSRGGSTAARRAPRVSVLRSIDQLKEVFERDRGNVRLIALLSPT
jgi:hypothetical protein